MSQASVQFKEPLLFKLGIPEQLKWGYFGVLFFMTAIGIESNFLTPHLVEALGSTEATVASIITGYSLAVMVGSYFTGALSDLWGPKKVILLGFSLWIVFHIGFLLSIGTGSVALVGAMYFMRGFGFPLVSFGFLVWINQLAMPSKASTAVGWFYFMFTGGLPTLGSLIAIGAIPAFGGGLHGESGAMWFAAVLAVIGFCFIWFPCKDPSGMHRLAPKEDSNSKILLAGVSLALKNKNVLQGFLVRIINTGPQFAMFIILPSVIANDLGWGQTRWLLMTVCTYAANIGFNAFFGALGDKIGWVFTVRWFGIVATATALVAWWYVPHLVPAGSTWGYFVALAMAIIFGICLAGFTPIGAMIPAVVDNEHKGAAMAVYTTAAGGATFVGSAVVALTLNITGAMGWSDFAQNSAVIWVFVALFACSFVMVGALKSDHDDPQKRAEMREADTAAIQKIIVQEPTVTVKD